MPTEPTESVLDLLEEHPPEAAVPARIVLDDEVFDELLAQLGRDGEATDQLVELMRG